MSATPRRRHHSSRHKNRLQRAFRYRLVIPMLRARHAPEYAARGTMVGLVLAFTPTIGLHMTLALAVWAIATRLFKWEFSLILALAWTWVSNVFTGLPIYYLLYVTGQLLMGRWQDLSGYAEFIDLWHTLTAGDHTIWQDATIMAKVMLEDWGVAMCVGSVPWAVIAGGVGYGVSLKFIRAYRREKAMRRGRNAVDRSRY